MSASMVSFNAGEWRFHLRAAAVVRHGDFVLLHRRTDDAFWALPGGRLEIGETAELAVIREMREELGVEVRLEGLQAVVENFFVHRGRPQHGLELHVEVALADDSALLGCEPFERIEGHGVGLDGESAPNTRMLFQWFHLDDLDQLDLRPAILRCSLRRGEVQGVQHFVHDDRA